jgi:uncharacterized protein YceH (UPF0502 family)
MESQLTGAEVRVLGALIEKEMATPEYYPLSLNALVNACNQKSNRDPVVSYGESEALDAVDGLREKGLALVHTGGDNRVAKYSHRIAEKLNLGNRELALVCELLLRGPQTPGELRSRSQRLHNFDDLASVESCLDRLTNWEPGPLARKLARQPGARESRYAHLLSGEPAVADETAPAEAATGRQDTVGERVARLEAEIAALGERVEKVESRLEEFRKQFE